ncbi:MAG TPA: hypothetical protein DHW82_05685 [Spirochaetia bacterium]|nr:MAG: hypothetical protein A2Y41_10785 [Spirochaetes bacterium GWB1_36_13]HCL56484.1 hypothetical protein [Spirochaetia bacterium]
MRLLTYFGEIFYAPKSFIEIREKNNFLRFFLNVFYFLSYFLLAASLSNLFEFPLSLFQLFLFTGLFYTGSFIKTGIYSFFLNKEKALVSSFDIWKINAVSLYPLFIFLPLSMTASSMKGIQLLLIISAFLFVNFNRKSWIERFFSRKAVFIWIVSFSGILLSVFFILFLSSIGIGFAIALLKELMIEF